MTATAARGKFPYRAHRTLKQVFYDLWMVHYLAAGMDAYQAAYKARYRASRAMRP